MQTTGTTSITSILQQLKPGAVVQFQSGSDYLAYTVFNGALILTWVPDQSRAMVFTLDTYKYSAGQQTATATLQMKMEGGEMYVIPMQREVNGLTNPVLSLPTPAQIKMALTNDPSQQTINLQTMDGSAFSFGFSPVNYVTFAQDAGVIDLSVIVLES